MPPSDSSLCGGAEDIDLMVANHHHKFGHHDDENNGDDDACYKATTSAESLEDTLSLTCDDSMESTLSSSSSSDNSEASCEIKQVYRSPDLLRRRLLPVPPSPIAEQDFDDVNHPQQQQLRDQQNNEKKTLIRPKQQRGVGGATGRFFFWFLLSIVSFTLTVTTDFQTISESLTDATYSEETRQWKRFFRRKAPRIVNKISSHKPQSREFTIRLKGQRLDLMLQSLDFHAQCPFVHGVQIDWTGGDASNNNSNNIPQAIMHHKSGKVQTLSEKLATPAVFLLDEDVLLTCEEMERGKTCSSCTKLLLLYAPILVLRYSMYLLSCFPFFLLAPSTAFNEWRVDASKLVGFYPFQINSLRLLLPLH